MTTCFWTDGLKATRNRVCAAALGLSVLGAACQPAGAPSGRPATNANANSGAGGTAISGQILNFLTDVQISGAAAVTLRYTVSESAVDVSAFYVEVSDPGPGAPELGERRTFAPGLPTGTQQVDLATEGIPLGIYRLGVTASNSATTRTFLSVGTLQIQGPPNPVFLSPTADLSGTTGLDVSIRFDARDPEGAVQWRLFYESTSSSGNQPGPDQRGTQLAVGSGNVGIFLWDTTDVAPGMYLLGASATDSGTSVSATAAAGNADRIVTILSAFTVTITAVPPPPMPPTLSVTQPAGDVSIFQSGTVTVQFAGEAFEGNGATINVFYDVDRQYGTGDEHFFSADLAETATSATLNTSNLSAGTYSLGAAISDGVNPPVAAYAAGRLIVVTEATLTTQEPSNDRTVPPGTMVTVSWTTNVPASAGMVDVYALSDPNGDGVGEGTPIVILGPTATTTMMAPFDTMDLESGRYLIYVRITFTNASTAALVQRTPGIVRVSTLPPILWVGSLADVNNNTVLQGAVFGGVNFEDNTGSAGGAAGDLDGDGAGEFVIVGRYAKPFFSNPTGIGHGEAYVIYGGATRLRGEFNLNSVGIAVSAGGIRGVNLAGIRTPQGNLMTDGLASISRLPDVDGDGRDELVLGFPNTDSRGHNVDPEQNGVFNPLGLSTLEREKQFLRGGIVIVSSTNSILRDPTTGSPVINLDLVGQVFDSNCVDEEPVDALVDDFFKEMDFFRDIYNPMSTPPCLGSCVQPQSGGGFDSSNSLTFGFVKALARDYFFQFVYSSAFYGGVVDCGSAATFLNPFDACPLAYPPFLEASYCVGRAACEPFSPGLHNAATAYTIETETVFGLTLPVYTQRSGFYTAFIELATMPPTAVRNRPREPFGARIIGVGLGDRFGTSLTLSNALDTGAGDIIISSPARTARGILLGPQPQGCNDPPQCGGEISGLESAPGTAKTNADAGVAYLFSLRSLWTDDSQGRVPPRPHQFIAGEASHCGGPLALIPNIDAVRIAGNTGEKIENVIGLQDFNRDGRNDIAVGAPLAANGDGKLYIVYRREAAIEGDFVLEKLALAPNDPQRLAGVLIVPTAGSGARLGTSVATGLDFNQDGVSDLVVSAPNANTGTGDVYVIYGNSALISPMGGISLDTLVSTGRAARIMGNQMGAQFGFNIANAGDVDGDGSDDLLVAAPNGSPMFDANPNDLVDSLTIPGVDINLDGVKDDVSGLLGLPDGLVDDLDNLENAGLVYIILGSNQLTGTTMLNQLGTSALRGAIIVGRRGRSTGTGHMGDRLGGGDAGDMMMGGIMAKMGRGRSFGLASAGDVDGDGKADIVIGSILATSRIDPTTGQGVRHSGEAYLIYGFAP